MSEYVIVAARHTDDLEDRVNERLQEGYTLIGGPFVCDGKVGQAMLEPELTMKGESS